MKKISAARSDVGEKFENVCRRGGGGRMPECVWACVGVYGWMSGYVWVYMGGSVGVWLCLGVILCVCVFVRMCVSGFVYVRL